MEDNDKTVRDKGKAVFRAMSPVTAETYQVHVNCTLEQERKTVNLGVRSREDGRSFRGVFRDVPARDKKKNTKR